MTTSKKTVTKPSGAKNQTDFPKAYMRLRTVLDALEIGALRYCLKELDDEKRIKRAQEVEAQILPIIDKLKDKTRGVTCAEGYFNCGGVCVPYQCPENPSAGK